MRITIGKFFQVPCVLLLILVFSLTGSRLAEAEEGSVTVTPRIDMGALDAEDRDWEWTPEEMMHAKPYPIPVLKVKKPKRAADENTEGEEIFLGAIEPLDYAYPPPYDRYRNFNHYRKYPYRTIGKLFFRQYGSSYVCSASSIGNFAILTAGHCVHAGDGSDYGWSTNMVFVPAYRRGNTPYGQWKAVNAKSKALAAWVNDGDFRYDVGGAILKKKNGEKISEAVGKLDAVFNQGENQHWFSIGYPVGYPFNGEKQIICTSSFAYYDTENFTEGPFPLGIGCDMTGGASGGPWILNFRRGSSLNGIVSYRRCNDDYCFEVNDHELFSPYFGDEAATLYNDLINDCPSCP